MPDRRPPLPLRRESASSLTLVIQGLADPAPHLPALAALSGSSGFTRIGGRPAYRLFDATPHPDIPSVCKARALDWGYVPDGRQITDFRLAALDMDSTLISIECIDELAQLAGVRAEVAALTERAMRGEIDFSESFPARVRLLRGLSESALQRVYDERLTLNPGAGKLIEGLRQGGVKTCLISGGHTFFTEWVRNRLGLDFAAGNTLEIANGRLTGNILGEILDGRGKAEQLERIRVRLGLARDQLVAVGDGANDLEMMAAAGVSIAYRAKPLVSERATYALDHAGLDGILNLLGAT
jgi:phosphoserine phosphatase